MHVHVRIHACMHTRKEERMYVFLSVCMYVCMRVGAGMHVQNTIWMPACKYTCGGERIYLLMYVSMETM